MNSEQIELLKKKIKDYAPYAAMAVGAMVTQRIIDRQAQRLEEYDSEVLPWTHEPREMVMRDGANLRFIMRDGLPVFRVDDPED